MNAHRFVPQLVLQFLAGGVRRPNTSDVGRVSAQRWALLVCIFGSPCESPRQLASLPSGAPRVAPALLSSSLLQKDGWSPTPGVFFEFFGCFLFFCIFHSSAPRVRTYLVFCVFPVFFPHFSSKSPKMLFSGFCEGSIENKHSNMHPHESAHCSPG